MVIPFPPDSSAPLVLLGQLRRFPLRLKQGADRGMDRKRPPARSLAWPVGLLVALCFTTLPLFLAMAPGRPALSGVWRKMGIRVTVSYDGTYARPSCTATIRSNSPHLPTHTDQVEGTKESAEPPESRDVLLGGLLSPDIDQNSCLSRYQSSLYRKPSPYLVSWLRRYVRGAAPQVRARHARLQPFPRAAGRLRAQPGRRRVQLPHVDALRRP
jgi:hypothetical protein